MATFLRTAVRGLGRERSFSITAQLALLLLGHVLLWTWVGVSSRSNFDVPGDMVEAYAWGQGWAWGYYKHPPLSAWVTGLWFSVVPESHWGYSLLAAVNGTVGLAGLAVLARRFLPPPWVLLAVAVASLAPGLTTLAMRFNANAILVSTWPWATALFLRLMERGRRRDALLCGAVCALAMLGKYFSAVLLFSLLATALWWPAWRQRLLGGPVLLAVAVFALCLAPHGLWLLAQTEGPLQYARNAGGHGDAGAALLRALHFALAQIVFPLIALVLLRVALTGPLRNRAFFAAVTAPLRPRHELPWLLALLPVATTMAITVITGARTAWVWGLAIAAGLALLAACRAREAGAGLDLRRLWQVLLVVWALLALLSPLWWQARAALRSPAVTEPREELAQAVAETWRRQFGRPLPWVGGTRVLAASVAFYADEHPGYWSLWNRSVETPWVDDDRLQADGGAIVCALADAGCEALAEAWSADRRVLRVAKHARGHRFEARDYAVYLVEPGDEIGER
ncbi:MAG: glycosyltransferase family 39 protein [Rubrivivax sp.]